METTILIGNSVGEATALAAICILVFLITFALSDPGGPDGPSSFA